jgi:phosphoglycolate phosphatase
VPEDKIETAVEVFRGRYTTVGKFENTPYPGIRELLAALQADGHRLYVATSKPEVTAKEILDKFDLSRYFDRICGAALDGSRDDKAQVIAYLLGGREPKDVLMVGDTAYDVLGAKAHGIPTVGVAWGYGDTAQMLEVGAVKIVEKPEALLQYIRETH